MLNPTRNVLITPHDSADIEVRAKCARIEIAGSVWFTCCQMPEGHLDLANDLNNDEYEAAFTRFLRRAALQRSGPNQGERFKLQPGL